MVDLAIEQRKVSNIAARVFEVCKEDLTDSQYETNTDNFDFDRYSVIVAAWLDKRWGEDMRFEYIDTMLGDRQLASRGYNYLPRVAKDTIECLRENGITRFEDWEKVREFLKILLRCWCPKIFEDKAEIACEKFRKIIRERNAVEKAREAHG